MSSTPEFPLEFNVTELPTSDGNYQTLAITLTEPQDLILPLVLEQLELPPELDLNREVILYGTGPNWLYGHLISHCKTAPWVACYDVRTKGIIVVQSRVKTPQVGDMIPIFTNSNPGTGIIIGGPPDSGKSVLSYALRQSLRDKQHNLNVFLHRANWDGEGNWGVEMSDRATARQLKEQNTRRIYQRDDGDQLMREFFQRQANDVKNIKDIMDLVLVDIGGKAQNNRLSVVQQCSHYIIISRDSQQVQEWHDFFGQSLKPLVVIHSVLEQRLEILRTEPFLEVIAGPWITGETLKIPDIILAHILRAIQGTDCKNLLLEIASSIPRV